eukprot:TRINITY_DN23151_c0_g1_i1.p1 TRINITY_DN23151_c0_g1~~TRINITY_DN23151_c0_g1_i1.p1  ORF type:complete len:364 (+),score=82.59 TRINITY_DN23151_c0_g1_i1:98-1189(+)
MRLHVLVAIVAGEVCAAIHLPSANEAASISELKQSRGQHQEAQPASRRTGGHKLAVEVLGEETAFLDLSGHSRRSRDSLPVASGEASHQRDWEASGASGQKGYKKYKYKDRQAARQQAGHGHHHVKPAGGGSHPAAVMSYGGRRKASEPPEPQTLRVVDVTVEDPDPDDAAADASGLTYDGGDHREEHTHLDKDFEALPGLAMKAWHSLFRDQASDAAVPAQKQAASLEAQGVKAGSATTTTVAAATKAAAAEAATTKAATKAATTTKVAPTTVTTTESPLPVAGSSSSGSSMQWPNVPNVPDVPDVPQPRLPAWGDFNFTGPPKKLPWACQTASCKLARLAMSVVVVTSVMAFVCCLNCMLT